MGRFEQPWINDMFIYEYILYRELYDIFLSILVLNFYVFAKFNILEKTKTYNRKFALTGNKADVDSVEVIYIYIFTFM